MHRHIDSLRRMRSCSVTLALVFVAWGARVTAAESLEIAVQLGAEEIYAGESVDYLVEIRNTKTPSAPDLSAIRELFDVAANGDESRNQSSTYIINGRVSQQNSFSHLYRFRLTPKQTGEITIPAAIATIEGKVLTSETLSLRVIPPEIQDLVIAETIVNKTKLYPTQPFEVTLRILVRPLPDESQRDPLSPLRRQPPHIEANWVDSIPGLSSVAPQGWLSKLLSEDGTGFTLNDVNFRSGSIFDGPRAAVLNLSRGRELRKDLNGNDIKYFVYELKQSFRPEKGGTYTFGPGLIKGAFVNGSANRSYSVKRLVTAAPAVMVTVIEVPTPRPDTFCGGIGDYTVAASVTPVMLRVGDPLTLSLEVRRSPGSGSLELISAPDLTAISRVTEGFEIIDKSPTGRVDGEVKRFSYAMRPKKDVTEFPPLSITVFDPDSERFVDIPTDPIPLQISAASFVGAGDLVGSRPSPGSNEIRSREQGIFQNLTDLAELGDQRINMALLVGSATGVWTLFGFLWAVVTWLRRNAGDIAWQRRQRADSVASRRLAEARRALKEGHPDQALRTVRAALLGRIADQRNIVADGLTAAEADRILTQMDVSVEVRQATRTLLEMIEAAEYGSSGTTEADTAIKAAEELLRPLSRSLTR